MTLPLLRTHTDAVIAALVALGGPPVGDAHAPDEEAPYYVAYPVPGGESTGNLGSPSDDAVLIVQVTCVGKSREQAQWMADKATEKLLNETLTVADRKIARIKLDTNPGVRRDDDVTPPVFTSMPRFRLMSTPA